MKNKRKKLVKMLCVGGEKKGKTNQKTNPKHGLWVLRGK